MGDVGNPAVFAPELAGFAVSEDTARHKPYLFSLYGNMPIGLTPRGGTAAPPLIVAQQSRGNTPLVHSVHELHFAP